jgi:hypothetical protein
MPICSPTRPRIGILNSLWIVFALIVIAGFAVPAARKPALRTPAP